MSCFRVGQAQASFPVKRSVEWLGLLLSYRVHDRDCHLGHPLTSSTAMLYLWLAGHSLTFETDLIDLAESVELAEQAGGYSYCQRCFVIEQEMVRGKSAMSSSQSWAFGEVWVESHGAVLLLSCHETSLITAVAAYVLSEHFRGTLEVVYDFAKQRRRRLMRGQHWHLCWL